MGVFDERKGKVAGRDTGVVGICLAEKQYAFWGNRSDRP